MDPILIDECLTPYLAGVAKERGLVAAEEPMQLFNLALDVAERQDSLINLLIEVHVDGTVGVRNWARHSGDGHGPPALGGPGNECVRLPQRAADSLNRLLWTIGLATHSLVRLVADFLTDIAGDFVVPSVAGAIATGRTPSNS